MNIFTKMLPRILILAIITLLVAFSLFYFLAYQSLPRYNNTIVSDEISSKIEIIRDVNAVPHIFGKGKKDIIFGLGYTHAQERFWQMNFLKRIAQGRLSEIVGKDSIDLDVLMKTLDLQSISDKIYSNQSMEVRELLKSYSNGINLRISEIEENGEGRGSPELFFFPPQMTPWSPTDSISILKLIEFLSTDKASKEILFTKLLLSKVENEKLIHLIDDVENLRKSLKPIGTKKIPFQPEKDRNKKFASTFTGFQPSESGFLSNTYAVDSTRSASKKSILATDSFLPLSTPSIWMLTHLNFDSSSVIGASIPGIPVIFSGKNNNVAWASSFSSIDDQDLFYEKLNPKNYQEYLTVNGYKKFEIEEKLIRVKEQPTRKIMLRKTENGIVLPSNTFDINSIKPVGHEISLSWTGYNRNDSTLASLLNIMSSESISDLKEKIFENNTFNLNLVLADKNTVDMIFIGQAPIRPINSESKGRVISTGWSNTNQWEKKSASINREVEISPLKGVIANTNNRFFYGNFPNHLSFDWGETQRMIRATKLINGRQYHTRESFKELQNDTISETARTLLPLLGKELWYQYQGETNIDLNRLKSEGLTLLSNWNGDMNSHTPEPLIYKTWISAFQRMVVEDELGLIIKDFYQIQPLFLEKILRDYEDASDWCDIKYSNKRESCSLLAKESLEESLLFLKDLYGPDITAWRWGESNTLQHSSFSSPNILIPSFLRDISHEMPGGRFTLNSSWSEKGIEINEKPKASGFRMIIDFSEPDKSLFIISTGQSGHFLSKNYDDLTNLWKQGDYITISSNIPIILGGSKGKVIISPSLIK
ncbi:MAG: hypothetical protein CML38_08050 [Rhodobacteraceae bacterium]|nr:MAG: hypothetical protein CML38_08050 [Paracoccaceae bacterium]